jgi:hypothetical protein
MTTNASGPQPESNPLAVLGEALEAAAESVGDARADATASAKLAAIKVQHGVSKGAYYAAYGISYGVVFSGIFLKELLPTESSIRRGFEQGVHDGAKAATDVAARIHTLPESVNDELVEEGAAPEPGIS